MIIQDNKYTGKIICRGSYFLGTACGACEKCKDESWLARNNSSSQQISSLESKLSLAYSVIEKQKNALKKISAYNKNDGNCPKDSHGPDSKKYWMWQELISRDIAHDALEECEEMIKVLK